jgi:hypothetical protein
MARYKQVIFLEDLRVFRGFSKALAQPEHNVSRFRFGVFRFAVLPNTHSGLRHEQDSHQDRSEWRLTE